MKRSVYIPFLRVEKNVTSNSLTCSVSLLMLFVLNMFVSSATAQELDPTVPPSGNFDLSYWKLTRPNNTERDEDALIHGYYKEDEFCVFLPFRVGLHAFDDVTVGKPFSIVRWKHSLASEQNQPPEEQMRDIFLKYSPSLRVELKVNKVKLRFP